MKPQVRGESETLKEETSGRDKGPRALRAVDAPSGPVAIGLIHSRGVLSMDIA